MGAEKRVFAVFRQQRLPDFMTDRCAAALLELRLLLMAQASSICRSVRSIKQPLRCRCHDQMCKCLHPQVRTLTVVQFARAGTSAYCRLICCHY